MKILALAAAAVVLGMAGAARSEVIDKGPSHFRIKAVYQIAAPPSKVYQAIGEVGRWWDDAHSYSGKAANMTMPLRANACWCETLPDGGSVRHAVVVLALPDRGMIRLDGALGPLQDEGVSAAMLYRMTAKDGGTELTVTYNVGGVRDFTLQAAPAVDGVLTGSWARLKRYVETGAP